MDTTILGAYGSEDRFQSREGALEIRLSGIDVSPPACE